MKITPITNNNQRPNFKKGLTLTEINTVRKMNEYEHANIADRLKNAITLKRNLKVATLLPGVLNELQK